ncbi:MAG: hypothetical protein IJ733_03745 [Lachnospiraceae bacterium]|nr:hypothetical protein [Lachnospiraceae bacterium]
MRFRNAIKNSFFSVLAQIVLIFLGFGSSRVLNHQLGETLVGVNGVISNVIGVLSISELGFSTAVVYHLYRELAAKDEEKIAALMNLYRRAYQIIAGILFFSGLCLLPFIHHFMRENPFSVSYIRTLYLLWLLRTVLNYLLGYRRSILIADQREYVVSIVVLATNFLDYMAVILVVFFTKNYMAALGMNIVFEGILNCLLNRYIEKKYIYLSRYRKLRLDREGKALIFQDIKNIFFSQIAVKLLWSTDNLIISGMIGVAVNGLFNNYSLISTSVTSIVRAAGNSIQPTMANLFLEKDSGKSCAVFRQLSFLFFWIASFVCASLLCLMTPFVREFWLGEKYILADSTVIFMAACTAVHIMGMPLAMSMTVSGLFRIEKYLSGTAAVANIILSVVLVKPLGVNGVIFGTIFAHAFSLVVRGWNFFGKYLKLSIRQYAFELMSYFLLIFAESFLTVILVDRFYVTGNLGSFLLSCMICVCVPNGINLLIFFRTWRFRSMLGMFLGIMRRKSVGR